LQAQSLTRIGTISKRTYWWSSKPTTSPEPRVDESKLALETSPHASPEVVDPAVTSNLVPPTPPSIPQSTVESAISQPPLVPIEPTALPLDSITEPLTNHAALALATIPASAIGRFYLPIGGIQHIFVGFSSLFPSLPAWEVILAGSFLIRAAVAPWAIDQMRASNKMTSIRPEMSVLQEDIKNAENPQKKQIAALKLQKLFKEHDIRPTRMIGNVIITLVPSLFSFFAVRRFCTADPAIPGMVTGGAGSLGWIGDLTMSDPTFILPAIAFVGFQAQMTVMQWEQAVPDKATWQAHLPNLLRVVMIVTTPVFAFLPSGVFVYFIGTAAWGIIQGLLLRVAAIRALVKLPPKVVNAVKPPSMVETFRKVRSWWAEKKRSATTGW